MSHISIEIAFATVELQKIISLQVVENCTIKEAIRLSQINEYFPEFSLPELPVGIFGKRIFEPDNYLLKEGDRIEIYRQLNKSPNQKRLERATGK